MEFFRFKRDIPFMKYALIFNAISLVTFLIAVGALFYKGLHYGIRKVMSEIALNINAYFMNGISRLKRKNSMSVSLTSYVLFGLDDSGFAADWRRCAYARR